MPAPDQNTFTLNEFVNIVKSLELGSSICKHSRTPISDEQYHQLPFNVSCELIKLDRALHDPEWHFLNAKDLFQNLIRMLISSSIANNNRWANSETQQSEYLLGFFLSNDMSVMIDEKEVSIAQMVKSAMPRRSASISPYGFLTSQWRDAQEYPLLITLNHIWLNHCQELKTQQLELERQRALQEQFEEAQREEQEYYKQRYQEYRATHSFDNMALSLNQFSFALEGFLASGRIELFSNQFVHFKPVLSPEVSHLMNRFAEQVRANGWGRPDDSVISNTFVDMMKSIIASAKLPSPYQQSAQQLLGFMLFHNFALQHQNQLFRVSDIFLAEMSALDYQRFQQQGFACMPFLSHEWQQNQCFPGKRDLEMILGVAHCVPQKSFIPFYYQQCQQQQRVEQALSADDCVYNSRLNLCTAF